MRRVGRHGVGGSTSSQRTGLVTPACQGWDAGHGNDAFIYASLECPIYSIYLTHVLGDTKHEFMSRGIGLQMLPGRS